MKIEMLNKIRKYLNKKKESVVVDLVIKDYNKSNFYIALVFNKKIMKFKVLFVPIDAIVDFRLQDFFCYQFINANFVNSILTAFDISDDNSIKYDLKSKNTDLYYIEINSYIRNNHHCFKTTRYIPKEWLFMFDSITILFEHVPNILGELCSDILAVLSNCELDIDYDLVANFDLKNDKLEKLFGYNSFLFNNIKDVNIEYLEKVDGKFFSIVNDSLILVDYNNKGIINLYSSLDGGIKNMYFYGVLDAIKKGINKPFYKLQVNDNGNNLYYLCFGCCPCGFKVLEGAKIDFLSFDLLVDGRLKFISSVDNNLKNDIRKYVNENVVLENLE